MTLANRPLLENACRFAGGGYNDKNVLEIDSKDGKHEA
jgi:hypothetical protein